MARDTCYIVTMPPTRDVGSHQTRVCRPLREVRAEALWDYNSGRAHEGLPPVKRLPNGTKIRKETAAERRAWERTVARSRR